MKWLRYHLVFVYLLFCLCGHTQTNETDSLWKIYNNKTQVDTARLNAINSIAWSYAGNNPDTAIILAHQQLQLASSLPSQKGKKWVGKAYSTMGAAYNYISNYPKALENYLMALKIREELGDKKGVGTSYGNIAMIYKALSIFPKALAYYLKALKINEEANNKEGIGYCYNNIGVLYHNQLNYSKSLEYSLKALRIREEIGDKQGVGNCYINIGNVYYAQGDYSQAITYFLKALIPIEEAGDNQGIATCYNNMGLVYTEQKNYAKALEYYLKSLRIKEEVGNKQSTCLAFINIAELYNKLPDFRLAILYCDSTLPISREIGDIDNERLAYKNLAIAYEKAGRYKEAYEYHVKFKYLTDSIFNDNNSKQLGDMKTQFEVEKKEVELKAKAEAQQVISAEEKKRQQLVIYAVIGVLLIVMLFSFFLYKRFRLTSRQKEIIEIKNKETEVQKHLIEEKQKEIIESITYAKRLQEAILPPEEFVNKYLPDNFILYKPKDIVAGDFYWAEKINDLFFIAAADSTGHGVPGAMVSVVCSNALNRSVKEFHLTETGKILDKTRELVLETFEKSTSEVKDGMDISLLCIDNKNKHIFWSGANNPLWYISISVNSNGVLSNELNEIKANKQPIGKTDYPKPFTTHQIEYKENTTFYLFTDGLADQFGGPGGKKFKYKQFSDFLVKNNELALQKQKVLLEKVFTEWKGDLEQVDDVCVMGIKL